MMRRERKSFCRSVIVDENGIVERMGWGGCSDGVIRYIESREQEIGVLCAIEADDDDESNGMKLMRKLNSFSLLLLFLRDT